MADPVAVKRALARLASDADADRAVIEQADAAVDELEAAVTFVEAVGVARLAIAVERQRRAGNTDVVARGERTLAAFQRYRQAAGTTTHTPSTHQSPLNQPSPSSQSSQPSPSSQSSQPSPSSQSSQPSPPSQSSQPSPASGLSQPDSDQPGSGGDKATERDSATTDGTVSNGNVGGRLDLEPFEHGLETVGVGIQPVDDDGRSENGRRTDGGQGVTAESDGTASGWVTLDGEQFHSHSGYGNGLGTASEGGRR